MAAPTGFFLQKDERLTALGGTSGDHMRSYVLSINYFYFLLETFVHLATRAGRKPSEYEQAGEEFEKLVRTSPINRPHLWKTMETFTGDERAIIFRTLEEYRQHQNDFGLVVKALGRVEERLRVERVRKHPRSIRAFRPEDFTVYKELKREKYFRYPSSTWIYEVWPDDLKVLLVVDMIRENGKLKIIAIYPPMD